MMDRELELLRAAALISMEEKNKQQEAAELAALREAALDSARERKLSSDPLGRRSVEGLGKRRLESPPSHHTPVRRSGGYESYSDSEESGNMTPKMTADDSIKHTPPRCDPVFTIKVTDHMLLKRNSKRSSSCHSNVSEHSSPHRPDDKITVQLRNDRSASGSEEERGEEEEEVVVSDEVSDSKDEVIKIVNNNHKSPLHRTLPKEPVLADVSPVLSKVSSVEDLLQPPPLKKQKKKHKKKKTSSKTKKPKHKQKEPESESEDDKPVKKSNSHQRPVKREQNGNSARREKLRAAEARLEKLQSEFKKQVISENIINKIDKNIEMLQNAKKHKHENKNTRPVAKKIISEDISSGEEEELLNEKKKSPKSRKDRSRRSKKSDSQPRSKSPASPVDVSVSLKSKREFEQMKAEMNKKATKPDKKDQTPKKESKSKNGKEQSDAAPIPDEQSPKEKGSSKKTVPASKSTENVSSIKDDNINKQEEVKVEPPSKPTLLHPVPAPDPPDFVSVMKEDSFSDSDQESDKVNITSDKKSSVDAKRRKSKKSKKKKTREDKSKKKKKRRKHSDSSDSDDSDAHDRKKKVKIDKSELNKIVQFLKQRDEAQKALDPKVPFNPKIINKETKPIEIKLKSKPKR